MIMPNTASAIVSHVSKHPIRHDFYIYMLFKDNCKNKKALQESVYQDITFNSTSQHNTKTNSKYE